MRISLSAEPRQARAAGVFCRNTHANPTRQDHPLIDANLYSEVLYCLIFKQEAHMTDSIARTERQLSAIIRRARRQSSLTPRALGDLLHMRQGMIFRLQAGEQAASRVP
jgi:hypothetical protein